MTTSRTTSQQDGPAQPGRWPASHDAVVFLLDVDNTLLDNDRVKEDMARQLRELLGTELADRFWATYEEVRQATGTVDLPLTFERFERYVASRDLDPERVGKLLAAVRTIIMEYPFATALFPETMATLAHLRTMGRPVIVSDGDTTYQPRKIAESGLGRAVDWQVVIYAHKEEHLDDILLRWPASYYVMVDDKPRILAETKRLIAQRVVTVQVMQGHYAREESPEDGQLSPPPDLTLARIGDLRQLALADFAAHLGH